MNLKEIIYTAIGQASMCWSETPKGVFDDREATKVAEDLHDKILDIQNKGTFIVTKEEMSKWYIGNDKYQLPLDKISRAAAEYGNANITDVFEESGTGKRIKEIF